MDTFMLYGTLTILAIGVIGSIGIQIAIIRLEYREWRNRKRVANNALNNDDTWRFEPKKQDRTRRHKADQLVKDYFTQLETQGGKS